RSVEAAKSFNFSVVTTLVNMSARDQHKVHLVSMLVKGLYGIGEDVFISLPTQLGRSGALGVANLHLSEEESQQLQKSAKNIMEPLPWNSVKNIGMLINTLLSHIQMNGQEVFWFVVKVVPQTIKASLANVGLRLSEIDWLLVHQANQRIIDCVTTKLEFPKDIVISNLGNYENTSAASIPLALDEAVRSGNVKEGDTIISVGFGAGLTWGSAIYKKKQEVKMSADLLTSGPEDNEYYKKKMLADSLTLGPKDNEYYKKKQEVLMLAGSLTPRPEDIEYFKKKQEVLMLADSLTPGPEDIKYFKKKQEVLMLADSLTPRPKDIEYFEKKQEGLMLADSQTPRPEDIEYFKKKQDVLMLADSPTPEDIKYFKKKQEVLMIADSLTLGPGDIEYC
nr:3-oxoacyl-[acyl-carrier-protein] synthase 3 [Tanacetum cinerariifolium]